MTNQQGVPEALRLANALECRTTSWPDKVFAAAELRRLHAEIEHVVGDVSKNGAESDMAQQPAPSAACPVDNNNFDHQTAADVLNGKTVSDEAMRKFVAVARWAHDDRVGLRATLLSVRDELASREAEIALLKKALMDAEAPQPSPTAQADSQPAPVCKGDNCTAVQGVGHSKECEAEHERSVGGLDTAGNRNPDARYAGYTGQPASHGYTADQLAAWREGVSARTPADSVLEDAARWQWLADYLIGERTDLDEGIVACATIDALRQFADAARKQGANHD